jgi:hypothetical protein
MAQLSYNVKTGIRWRWVFGTFAILLIIHLIINQDHGFHGIQKAVCNSASAPTSATTQPEVPSPSGSIPNIYHYVWVRKDLAADLKFEFKHFISAYSASIYFKPDAIYIHTDATEEQVLKAKESGDLWTRRTLAITNMVVRHVEVPTHAKNGVEIAGVEHRSDFVRPAIMLEFGGMYMDFDVIPIRDVKPLREANYNNVVGHELYEGVNNGAWLSKPGTTLMKLFDEEQHIVYDREWTTHSVQLLTRLSNTLVGAGNEVLIMERKAFTPTAWNHEDFEQLFATHPETKVEQLTEAQANATFPPVSDAVALWKANRDAKREEWQMDFSTSYVVHAMSPTHHGGGEVSGFHGITLEYVLARESNYARAAFPAVWHAIANKVISIDDK